MNQKIQQQKAGNDPVFNRIMTLCELLPDFLLTPLLSFLLGVISQSFGISLFGIPKHIFGSAIVTEIDLDNAFLPIPVYARVSMAVAVCQCLKKVVCGQRD